MAQSYRSLRRGAIARRLVTLAALFVSLPLRAQTRPSPHDSLARAIFKELIEINSSVSGGQVARAAQAVSRRLLAAGFPASDVVLTGPDATFQNVVATLRGRDAAAKPILLLAHLDVVEARRSDWSFDPYTFKEEAGWFYGRGTLDNKAGASVLVANLIRWKREKYVPSRDLIMVLTTDEETSAENGIQWLIAHRPELKRGEYALNTDAGEVVLRNGKAVMVSTQAAEKVYATFQLEVKNRGGHSSLPRPDNAIYALADGLAKLGRYHFPIQYNDITRTSFARAAELETGELAADLRAAGQGETSGTAIDRLSRSPAFNSNLRTTCVATMLAGGHAENALPQTAGATVNCRIFPGVDWKAVQAELQRVVGDTTIHVAPARGVTPSPPSPLRNDVFAALESVSKAFWPQARVVPTMSNGATDGLYLRNAGVPVYGTSGVALDLDDDRSHGRDERIAIQSFYDSREFWYRLVRVLTGGGATM